MGSQHKHLDSGHEKLDHNHGSHKAEGNRLHAEVYHPRSPVAHKLNEDSCRANGQEMRGMTRKQEKAAIATLDKLIKEGQITQSDKKDILYYKDHNLSYKDIRRIGEDMASEACEGRLDEAGVKRSLREALQNGQITEKDWDAIVKIYDKYKPQEA